MKMPAVFLFLLSGLCCSRNPDLQKDRMTIVALLDMERKAHFEKNASLFMSEFSDSMISVNRGTVMSANKDQTRKRIQKYFNSVNFIKWDDVTPPKISFSTDGTMAYAIVQKQVIIQLRDSLTTSLDTTDFAWVAIYRKTGNEWKIECNVSTNK